MLAQSLFAPVQPAAVQAGGVAVPAAEGVAFGRLVDQATRLAAQGKDVRADDGQSPRPEVLPAVPDADGATKLADGQGPQILPGASTPNPSKAPDAQSHPQILPGVPDQGANPDLSGKPIDTGPQILPDAQDADRATPPPSPPKPQDEGDPRPEVLPLDVGPTPTPLETVTQAALPSPGPTAPTAPSPAAVPPGATPTFVAAPDRRSSQTVSDARVEAAGSDTPATAAPAAAPAATSTAMPVPVTAANSAPTPAATPTAPSPEAIRAEAPAQGPAPEPAATSQVAAPSPDAPAFSLSRVAHETLADLSAQIVRRLEGKYTRFEMALTPEDLGRVDVSLEMGDDGSLTARLAFDSPLAAAEMRARADELRRQLEQAGFQLARDALDFGQRDASSGRHDGFERRSGRAFAAARALADRVEAAPLITLSLSLSPARDRVDVKV